jgi:hypothetical protein
MAPFKDETSKKKKTTILLKYELGVPIENVECK